MQALVPVAERSQPVDAVPLCQSSVTGKFEFPVAGVVSVHVECVKVVLCIGWHDTSGKCTSQLCASSF